MKYNLNTFNAEVDYYTKKLKGKINDKVLFVILNVKQHKAFYSLAPLSRAVHNLGGDMHVMIIDDNSTNLEILKDVWYVYDDWVKKKLNTKKVKALKHFVSAVNKRTKTKVFKEIFKGPDIILKAEKEGFAGTLEVGYRCRWHKKYRWKELLETAS